MPLTEIRNPEEGGFNIKLNSEEMLNFFVALSCVSLRAMVLNQGDFAPLPRHMWDCLETLLAVTAQGGISWVESRDAPTTKYLDQNDNSDKVEKSCT